MLISHKHKFIFIHVYKNAGTSITNALMPYAANKWHWRAHRVLKRFNIMTFPQPYPPHIYASDLIEKMGKEKFKSFFSFAIVRNPWDWQVSLYTYMLKNKKHRQHKLGTSFKSFDEYIAWRCSEEVRFQKDFIYSQDGKLLVDFIGRYENLEKDFQAVCTQIGITASLPVMNVSKSKPYREYYNDATRELVRRTFKPDIELFKYDF